VSAGVVPGTISLTGSPTPLSYEDTLYLMEYIQSSNMLDRLDAKLKLREHYGTPKLDVLGKLWSWTSHEWFLFYYQQRVLMDFDDMSGLLTIDAQAFDRKTAKALSDAIVEISRQWVNDYSWKVAREQIEFTEKLTASENAKLQAIKQKVVAFQSENHLLDPTSQSAAANTLTASLQASLATQESTLSGLMSFLSPESSQVQTLKAQIAATRNQLNAERLRATSTNSGDRLSTLNVEYTNLLLEEQLATNNYLAAAAALDAARIDATRKLKDLVVVEEPTVPDSATYPRYLYDLFTLIVVCVLLYTVVRLSVATILEHQD
jgi:capsular polysaccharide transport system permease protein